MKRISRQGCVLAVMAFLLLPDEAPGQTSGTTLLPPEKIKSMGQPPLIKPYLAGELTWNGDTDQAGGVGIFGLYKDLILPVSGGLGLSAEAYFGGAGSEWDGGARFFLTSRLLFLNIGVDYNAQLESTDFILGWTPYFRRGGLFGTGGNFRIEWIPTRGQSFNIGFQIPLEPHMGKTRVRKTEVTLPEPAEVTVSSLPTASYEALDDMRHAALWLVVNANLFDDEDDASYFKSMDNFRETLTRVRAAFDQKDAEHPEGHSFITESGHYHQAVDRAFAAAVGSQRGTQVADEAREILLDDILLPYDRLIGQFKKPDALRGFMPAARLRFAQKLDEMGGFTEAQRAGALGTVDRVFDLLERARKTTKDHWDGDERKVWLPLTLAVRSKDHDSQEELDALIERALQRPFEQGNTVLPTTASRFQLELVRSIRSAEDYHVLWIHDFAGKVDGEPDSIAHAVSINYIKTLAERVRQYGLMLDHRKLFFYDVTEEDPRKGEACFTGTGVGSEYAGPTWDDRGILVAGPALLELKDAARRLLRAQGYEEDDIPAGLQPKPRPANYDALVTELEESGRSARGLNVHKEVGFASKENTLAQAILYTMAPADTLFVVPDSIWASPMWAGQLVGAALRGCHVYVVAPSQDNAPAAGLPVLARTREIFGRLFEAGQVLHEDITEAGGHLRVGLYTRSAKSDDNISALREIARRIRANPWLIDEFPMPRGIADFLEAESDKLDTEGHKPQFIAKGTRQGRPKMRRKTQFFATKRALRAVADMPELLGGLARYIAVGSAATADPASLLDESPLGPAGPVLALLKTDPPPGAENALYFLTVGSKNQDPRSANLDGETSFIVAGPWSLFYYPDFLGLMANTTWIEKQEQLDELISVDEEKARRLGRMIHKVI